MAIKLYKGDLPAGLDFGASVAIDTETLGLLPRRDKLCLVQLSSFDVAVLKHYLAVDTFPLYCTKLASKLTRTYTDRHGLKDLVKELLGIELNKQQQSSDWGAHMLSDAQKQYAAQDVLYLHELKARLDQMLEREGRSPLAKACFDFVPTRASLDLAGWTEEDVFAH
jgi:ribonuclease D